MGTRGAASLPGVFYALVDGVMKAGGAQVLPKREGVEGRGFGVVRCVPRLRDRLGRVSAFRLPSLVLQHWQRRNTSIFLPKKLCAAARRRSPGSAFRILILQR